MDGTDVLIPGQHYEWAKKYIEYVEQVFAINDDTINVRIAKQIITAKYWEAYDCKDGSRQEYWRQVMMAFDLFKTQK